MKISENQHLYYRKIHNKNIKSSTPYFKGLEKNIAKDCFEISGSQTKAKVFAENIDSLTYTQIKNICSHPVFKDLPIRVMPDTHAGKTAIVGFTAPMNCRNGIIPGLISGDIGCGMLCVELDTLGKDIDFEQLDNVIRTYVAKSHSRVPTVKNNNFKSINKQVKECCNEYDVSSSKALSKLGTLGGGNHFIEIDKDKKGATYLVIHTGSRSFGQNVFKYHDRIAKEQNPYLIRDLSYLTGDEAKKYLEDMKIAIKYSQFNRRIIADEIIKQMGWKEKSSFESIHNYVGDDGIIRKGSIKANKNEKIIIPLNMRDGAIIAKGKGNSDWNNSAPHGAGRKLSRSEAYGVLDLDEYKANMKGIYSSCISNDTIDEAPMAYKNADEIINNIKDTAEIKDIIKPVFNFKD